MKFLRNKEVLTALVLQLIPALIAAAVAFSWDTRFGVLTLVLSGLLLLIFIVSTHMRYRRIQGLAADIDRILHSGDANVSLAGYREGELAVLQSEIHKMLTRLRAQKQQLLDDKVYLADAIADIAHQLRTPLTSINLLVQLLSDPQLTQQRRTELTHELLGLLSRIDWLITTLLKISRLDAGTVQLKQEKLLLEELLQKSCAPLLVPIELRQQTLAVSAEGEFTGDIAWTAEALSNILKNCMEHTKEGGQLRVRAMENALYSEITISDNGSGIHPEDLPHIFERFYKGKNSTDQSFGIGLALARTIITSQNGTVKAENNPDKGALFTVRFYKGVL